MNVGYEVYGKGEYYTRPILILKKLSPYTFIGIPMTTQLKNAPYRYTINFKGRESQLLFDQIKVMDARRLWEKMGETGTKRFKRIQQAVREFIS